MEAGVGSVTCDAANAVARDHADFLWSFASDFGRPENTRSPKNGGSASWWGTTATGTVGRDDGTSHGVRPSPEAEVRQDICLGGH